MDQKVRNIVIFAILATIILGPGTYAFAGYMASNGTRNILTDFWGFNVEVDDTGSKVDLGDVDVETSRFSMTMVKEDTSTVITSGTDYIWFDWNEDGNIQRGDFDGYYDSDDDGVPELHGGEIEATSPDSTTGIFTSPSQYPMGPNFVIWIFYDDGGETYQIAYDSTIISGSADSSAVRHMGNMYARPTDDGALSYSGLIRSTAIDDSTDYNYTAGGQTGNFEIRVTWATSGSGVNSQTNPNFFSWDRDLYAGTSTGAYWTHWGTGKKYAPTFLGFYCTNQDATDLGLDTIDFDFYYQGATNSFFAVYLDQFDGSEDLFYDSSDDAAPTFIYSFDVDINAAGALVYVGFFQDVEYSDFIRGSWGPTTDATILGTLGADWDWVA